MYILNFLHEIRHSHTPQLSYIYNSYKYQLVKKSIPNYKHKNVSQVNLLEVQFS